MDFMGYTYEDNTSRRMKPRKLRTSAPVWTRAILAILSLVFPGFGQIIQKRQMLAFDLILLWGASLLISRVFIIQTALGVWTPILMAVVMLIPPLISALSTFFCKNLPGDADSIVRSIFLYIFFFIVAIVPFYLLNSTFGFLVHRFPVEDIHMDPLLLNGDAVIVHRGAYGIKNIEPSRADSVALGHVVFHEPVPEQIGGDNFPVHMVLAAPFDTLRAIDGEIMVNSLTLNMPEVRKYIGPKNFGPLVVPKSQVFLVDNRGVFFPFYIENIKGRVVGVLWSRTSRGSLRWHRFGRSIEWLFEPFKIWGEIDIPVLQDSSLFIETPESTSLVN